jgi:hypothetical protein
VQVPTEDPCKKDYIVETNHRRFELRTYPSVKYFECLKMPFRFYVSRSCTIKELHLNIVENLKNSKEIYTTFQLF